MIDACQGLGFPVARKIVNATSGDGRDVAHIREGVSLPRLFSLSALCVNPAQARLDMLQWLIFNLCVNNHDAHGKNYSFFVSKAGLMPTPGTILVNVGFTPSSTSIWPWPSATSLLPRRSTHGSCWRWPKHVELPKRLLQQTLQQDGQRHTASS